MKSKKNTARHSVLVAGAACALMASSALAQDFSLPNRDAAEKDLRDARLEHSADWGTSTLITNNLPKTQGRLQVMRQQPRQIFDVSVMTYSAEFATHVGQPEGYVVDMPEGLGMLAFTRVTHGTGEECHINFAVKDSQDIRAGEGTYAFPYWENGQHLYPVGQWNKENLPLPEYRTHFGSYGPVAMVDSAQVTDSIASKAAITAGVRYYTTQRFKGYHYFAWHVGCAALPTDSLLTRNWELWVAKASAAEGFSGDTLSTSAFNRYALPKPFLKLVDEVMRLGTQAAYPQAQDLPNQPE